MSTVYFDVLAGSYDNNEPNCKYSASFDKLDAALIAYKAQSTRQWSALNCVSGKGTITLEGSDPFQN